MKEFHPPYQPATSNGGYALFATLSLLIIISSVTTITLARTMASFTRGAQEVEWAKQESAAEAAIIWAATELASAPELRAKEHFVDNASSQIDFGGYSFMVTVRSEEAKLDVNDAEAAALLSTLAPIASSTELAVLQEAVNRAKSEPMRLLDDVWFEQEMTTHTKACLRNRLTVFNGEQVGQGFSPPISVGRSVTAGRIFDLLVYNLDGEERGARVIILITGDEGDPYWTLDWRWIPSKKMEDCNVDEISS